MLITENLASFYLGREYDLEAGKALRDKPLLYQSKDLTTHAVCVGMTGSGKTGLCLSILEEAAIDGIPVIAIDPKGDLGNLLLAFPELRPADFEPWVDPDEATRKGVSVSELADRTAALWKKGLTDWDQDGERVRRYRDSVDMAIYTPGSSLGLPLTVLRSFAAPPKALLDDTESLRQRITASVSGLLALMGITADPVTSREHILLANILDRSWRAGRDLDLPGLIRAIQTPPLDKVGVVDIEAFYPAKERFALAMQLNNLLASPGFAAWLEGEPLDVGAMLHTPAGKPRLSVLSIAHLSDAERMSFVTILLGELISWMRSQSGTSSLRAILYMDEVFGYFPPSANPPSKPPMLMLLKQARAFGLGIVLATQNPVDLDYKGLSNAGTWFLGRLQTERDKARVLEGLEGASAAAGASFDRAKFGEILARLGNRVFLMNNVHEDQPVVFQTRWTLCYLHGPLSREQIRKLMADRAASAAGSKDKKSTSAAANDLPLTPADPAAIVPPPLPQAATASGGVRPMLPPGVPEVFLAPPRSLRSGIGLEYRPALLGSARLRFNQAKVGVDMWQDLTLLRLVDDGLPADVWSDSEYMVDAPELGKEPETGAGFGDLPTELSRAKSYTEWSTALKNFLYRDQLLTIWKCAALDATSTPEESEKEFRLRLAQAAREQRDADIERLRARYAPKLQALQEQARRAQQKVDKEKAQAQQSALQAAVAFGTSVLGALTGRKLNSAANIGRVATAAKAAGKAVQQHGDVGHASDSVEAVQQKMADLEDQLKQEIDAVTTSRSPDALVLEPVQIRPKKTDIAVASVSLAWVPGQAGGTSTWQPF